MELERELELELELYVNSYVFSLKVRSFARKELRSSLPWSASMISYEFEKWESEKLKEKLK